MEKQSNKLKLWQRTLIFLSAVAIVSSLFVPVWRIELDAPQYPEGLSLQIHANKIGGNVEIVNGLNHYIGMKTLHSEDFVEFTILPYILGAYAFAALLVALFGNKKSLTILLSAFVVFGIVAMADFWRWEYDYGHDLKPDAAIVVPGMAYQPPLIGFKQLLNFGAYSIPDTGGWLIVAAGLCMVAAQFLFRKRKVNIPVQAVLILGCFFLASCSHQPENIRYNKDNCAYCQMTIADERFGAELMNDKGKVFKFDDLSCMLNYKEDNKTAKFRGFYISNFLAPHQLMDLSSSFIIEGASIASPMGGNMAAFNNLDTAKSYAMKLGAEIKSIKQIGN
jgi:copper chaperone NosL